MSKLQLKSIDVHILLGGKDSISASVVNATPQEAFTMISMPALAGSIVSLVPNYELSEMPEKEG